LVKNKKEIKIVHESAANYTFLNPGSMDIRKEGNTDTANKTTSNTEKDILKARSIDLRKSKIRHKNRIVGGQNKQGHSSVYE
jgi:hypothetical protein